MRVAPSHPGGFFEQGNRLARAALLQQGDTLPVGLISRRSGEQQE
ncbi:MAG: hypothetical protein QM757_08645 [Paludibaculum sp.]